MIKTNYLYFNNDPIRIKGIIKFAVVPKVVEQLRECGYDPKAIFTRLSSLNSLLVSSYEGKDGSVRYKLHTPYGVFPFNESNNGDDLLILGFNESSFTDINTSLMHGIRFAGTLGTVIMVQLKAYDWFAAYTNGYEYNTDKYSAMSGNEAINVIKAHCYHERNGNISDNIDDKSEVGPELVKLLDLAENYSILSNDLENKKAEEVGQISYSGYEAIDYPRHDRIAYQFCIEKQNQQVFNAGTNVDILDSSGNVSFTAEVVEVKARGQNEYLTMLFTKEVDLSALPQMGWLRLSVSTVNMDVQLSAIKKIRSGKAKAKYFNNVLGGKTPQGFDNNDLTDLEKQLAQKKYPPNTSQINAIKNGINSKDVYLVMGPPGTGKTTVILEWVKYFVKERRLRVLVSSQNNKAVDNVLERLAEEKGIDTIRIGSEAKVQEEVVPYIFENKLSALRRRITDSTKDTLLQTDQAIKEWTAYLELLKDHVKKVTKLAEEESNSREYVERYIKPFKNRLADLGSENTKITDLIKLKREENKRNFLYKAKYENSNRLVQILLYLPMLYVWKRLEQYNNSIIELVARQNAIAESYNENYLKLKNNYAYFDEKIVGQYYEAYSTIVDSVNTIKKSIPRNYSDINLYAIRSLDEMELVDAETVRAYYDYINKEHKRAEALNRIIDEWTTEIQGTQNYALHQIVLDSADLVGATCIGVSSQKRFQDIDFDVTIIDEAGQIQLHNAFVPMSVSNKVIMLGDYMQIPPNADQNLVSLCEENDVDPELLGKSLFEKMYYELPEANKTLLDTQYRMPAYIADVISEWFYDGEYKSPDFLRGMAPAVPSISKKNFVLVNTPPLKDRIYEIKDPEGGYNNHLEAFTIGKLVEHILSTTDFKEKQIGIISAYKSQVKRIKNELKGVVGPGTVDEMVASLDSFQGQERDIIIYSFTRSAKRKATQNRIGFLNELRRLNVAMSRCKKLLIMIGDYEYLSNCKNDDADYVLYSKDGQRIINGSEAVFSEYIREMCSRVKEGKGEIIDVPALIKRIEV